MKIGIMQPYFLPYLGYFSLIKNTDYFVIFDTPQYIRRGWVNRNRILDAKGNPCYITIPVVASDRSTAIMDTEINYKEKWIEKIKGQLTVYKRKAPNYKVVLELINDIESKKFKYISELNIYTLEKVCEYLNIPYKYDIFSKMDLKIDRVKAPDEWALNITKALGYDTYINPPGGMSFFDRKKYEAENINLEFLKINLKPYIQRIGKFEEGLSIIDAMMFLKPEEINEMLDDYTILT